MSRLIDADALWEKMYKYHDNEGAKMPYGDDDLLIHRDSACFLIEEAPTIDLEPHWIPCSERRLPMNRDWYLGIFREPDTGWINPIPYVCDYVGTITRATTYEGWILHHCTDQDTPCEYYKKLQCVAWMPLPKPYKEE